MALSAARVDELRTLIASELEVGLELVVDEAKIKNDLKADSLDIVELIMTIEEQFNVDVPDDAQETVVTVGDLITRLNELGAE